MITYKDAGVDIDKGNQFVNDIKGLVRTTYNDNVVGDLGGFSGGIKTSNGSTINLATDGCGTKLLIAQQAGIHNTIGIDLVAMSVNDLIVSGSKPLAFLDYMATGKLDVGVAYEIIEGIVEGCIQAGCPLIGGETAELNGMYEDGVYDLAGFAIGEPTYEIHKDKLGAGSVLLGVSSNGIHSNGYSLARKVLMPFGDISELDLIEHSYDINILEELLKPTMIYVKALELAFNCADIQGVAHITGGGLEENVPRMLGPGLTALVSISSFTVPDIFQLIMDRGPVPEHDIRRTFNCGIGLVLAINRADVKTLIDLLADNGYESQEIGIVITSENEEPFSYMP